MFMKINIIIEKIPLKTFIMNYVFFNLKKVQCAYDNTFLIQETTKAYFQY